MQPPIIVVPHKAPPGSSLIKTLKDWLLIAENLTSKSLQVHTVQAKSKGSIVLIETAKIDHIWAKLKGAWYFS